MSSLGYTACTEGQKATFFYSLGPISKTWDTLHNGIVHSNDIYNKL